MRQVLCRNGTHRAPVSWREWCYARERSRWNSAASSNEQDSQKLMALIKQITALLDAKQERLMKKIRSA